MDRQATMSPEMLRVWLRGELPESDDAAAMAGMAAAAEEELALFDRETDALLQQLRQPDPHRELVCEAGCRDLLARARALPPKATALGKLGEYLLLREIKSGGMGALYEAEHTRLKRRVALKLIRTDRAGEAAAARFEREMAAVGQLDHPNLIHATDAGQAGDGRLYLVMELLEGRDLHEVSQVHGPLAMADACLLIGQAARGLHHAHEKGLVHRDVKPANLFLTRAGVVKVLDLGLAKLHPLEVPADGQQLTPSGHTMGTPDYLAPEQINDSKGVDRRADLYGLGCTLYHLLAGRPPFSGPGFSSLAQKLVAHAQTAPPSLAGLRPDLPAPLLELVDRLLAKAPAARPATALEVAELLQSFGGDSDVARLAGAAPAAAPPLGTTVDIDRHVRPWSRSRCAWVLAGLLLAGGAGVLTIIRWPAPAPVLDVLADHLARQPAAERQHLRFLTLSHCSAADAQLHRAALASWAQAAAVPVPVAVDRDGALLQVDLRALAWSAERWQALVRNYPYGLAAPDAISTATGEGLPYLRGDWFLVRVVGDRPSQPPVSVSQALAAYDRPLDLQAAAAELGVDTDRLRSAIGDMGPLRDLGLAALADGGTISRPSWEAVGAVSSLFQQAAQKLGVGVPYYGI